MQVSLEQAASLSDPNREVDDETLAQEARADPAALAVLYRRYAPRVYRYAYSRVGDAMEAEDLTARVFVDVIAALPRYRRRDNFAAWLFTIAYRRCADFHRQPPVEALGDLPVASPVVDPLDHLIRRETSARLEHLLAGLDESQRELLRLRYAAGLSHAAIGRVLGKREGAVKMALSRLIGRLKAQWEVPNE